MTSRRILSLIFIGLVGPFSGCVIYPYRAEVMSHQTAPAEGVKKLMLETQNGPIEVVCEADRKEIDIEAKKFARGMSLEEAKRVAGEITIESGKTSGDSSVYRIVTRMPEFDNRSRGVAFRIRMPQDAELDLDTCNGIVHAAGSHSAVRIKTSNGRIEVMDIKGDLTAETCNGDIIVRDVGGNVNVESSNGAIELARVGRDSVRAETSNGRIRVVDASGEASVRSSNGAIELRLRSTTAAPRVEVSTSNGSVSVEVPSDISAKLSMTTSVGRVKADLDHVAQVRNLEADQEELRATLNEGRGTIHIHSSVGSVSFRTVATR